MHGVTEWNSDWLPVCAETVSSAEVMARMHRNLCIVGGETTALE
jgi:hypothetical protein